MFSVDNNCVLLLSIFICSSPFTYFAINVPDSMRMSLVVSFNNNLSLFLISNFYLNSLIALSSKFHLRSTNLLNYAAKSFVLQQYFCYSSFLSDLFTCSSLSALYLFIIFIHNTLIRVFGMK